MNVLKALIAVTTMQLATTLKGVTPALVTLDTQAMEFFAQVLFSNHIKCTICYICHLYTHSDINECLSNNGGCHHNCHNSDGSYFCFCNNGYQLNGDGHTCEGML